MKWKSVSLEKAVLKCPLIIGLGPSAWPRVVNSLYFPKFKIIAYYDCQDNYFIRDFGVEVFSLKARQPDLEVSPVTPGQILGTQLAKEFLNSQKEPFVFSVYKSSHVLEKVCEENNWRFMGNQKKLAEPYENKRVFREVLQKVGIEPIPGENLLADELSEARLANFQKKFGQKKLVLQLAEVTYGGGSGTLFVDNPRDLKIFRERVAEYREKLEGKKKKIESVNVSPYLETISASIACCTTKFGVFCGPVQTQIIDLAEVGLKIEGRSGNYAGTDWGLQHYSDKIQSQARAMAKKFGQHMYENGYKGIFGLDLLIEEKSDRVWPMECNPRKTDVFPLISFLHGQKELVPFEVFHNLEHLGLDYEVDFKKLEKDYWQTERASQVLLHNRLGEEAIGRGDFLAGVYCLEKGRLKYQRSGFWLADLKSEDEYLFTEGIPKKPETAFGPHATLFRLIKKGSLFKDKNSLTKEAKRVLEKAYKKIKLTPVKMGLEKSHGLTTLHADRLARAVESDDLSGADLVNVVSRTEGGFWRPMKVAWRKELADEPAITQIRSKRARKQIKSDEKRLEGLGLEIKILPQIDEPLFAEWLALYERIMFAKARGSTAIGRAWLSEKKKKGKKVGAVLALKEGQIVGGNLFFEVGQRLCAGYGVAERMSELVGGLGLLLDYYFMVFGQKQGYRQISFGQDTNLYGSDLSSGLMFYKAKLGFSPLPAAKTYWVTTYFLNFDKLDDPVMFFGNDSSDGVERLCLYVIGKEKPAEPYLPLGISQYRLDRQEAVVKKHLTLFSARA